MLASERGAEANELNDAKKKMASETVTDGCEERRYLAGFLLGIFLRGAKSIVMQISFVMLLFSDQILGRGKSFEGGKLSQGGRPPLPLWKKASFETQEPVKQRKDNFKAMYRLLFVYLEIGYKGGGEVIQNILKSKKRLEVGSLCTTFENCQN